METNMFMIELTNKMFELGYVTPEWVADNIDQWVFSVNQGILDSGTNTKFGVHFGLYCKMIKNMGTEIH